MEYFVDAKIRFKGNSDIKAVENAIKEELDYEDDYELEMTDKGILTVILNHGFEFDSVRQLISAVLSTGMKKYGEDKLIAFQTCADCYFENYVTESGEFMDFCGDCDYP